GDSPATSPPMAGTGGLVSGGSGGSGRSGGSGGSEGPSPTGGSGAVVPPRDGPNSTSASDAAAPPPGTDAPVGPPPGMEGAPTGWAQAGGPEGTFRVPGDGAPVTWSVAANKNILWTGPLPMEGQGGIAVAGDTLFLETYPPFTGATSSNDVMG